MKRYIWFVIIFTFITGLLFNLLFMQENYFQYKKMLNIGQIDSGIKVVISHGEKKTAEIYYILKKYLDRYNGNIYCYVDKNEGGELKHKEYIYFTNEKIFSNIRLRSGRLLKVSENESEKYLSTKNEKNMNQIGRIADFAGDHHLEIRTLKSNLITNIFDRSFYLQIRPEKLNEFINALKKEGIYIEKSRDVLNDKRSYMLTYITVSSCFLILLLLVFYQIVNSYKEIATKKMLGFSVKHIWQGEIAPIIVIAILSMLVITILLAFVKFKDFNQYFFIFLYDLFQSYMLMLLITIFLLSVPIFYIKKVNILHMLKNRRPIDTIVQLNNMIKWILSIIFLVLAVNQFTLYKQSVVGYNNAFDNWEKTKEYAVIPEIIYPPGSLKQIELFSEESFIIEKKLYTYFNRKGAIYANFDDYFPENREENISRLKEPYKTNTITINPNYLKKHAIYDLEGRKIEISESESEYILLVPEKYFPYEKEIREYNQFLKNGYGYHEGHAKHHNVEEFKNGGISIVDQKIKIIWTKSEQNFFSYRLEINPDNNNCVKDPIARVLTESNGDLRDYYMVLGTTGCPFKIKIKNITNPSAEILPELRKYYDSENYIFPIVSVYDSIKEDIEKTNTQIKYIAVGMLILLMAIGLIIFQNTINFFIQYRKKLAIQHFHGFKKRDKYKKYFISVFTSWLGVLIVAGLFTRKVESIFIGIIMLIFELILTTVLLNYNEKRKVLKVTKGG